MALFDSQISCHQKVLPLRPHQLGLVLRRPTPAHVEAFAQVGPAARPYFTTPPASSLRSPLFVFQVRVSQRNPALVYFRCASKEDGKILHKIRRQNFQ